MICYFKIGVLLFKISQTKMFRSNNMNDGELSQSKEIVVNVHVNGRVSNHVIDISKNSPPVVLHVDCGCEKFHLLEDEVFDDLSFMDELSLSSHSFNHTGETNIGVCNYEFVSLLMKYIISGHYDIQRSGRYSSGVSGIQ